MKQKKPLIALSLLLGLAACDAPPGGISGDPPYEPSNTGSGGAPGHLIAEMEAKKAAEEEARKAAEAARQAQTAEDPELLPNAKDALAQKPGTEERLIPISEKLPDITRRPQEPERKSAVTPSTIYQAPAWFTDRGSLAQLGAVNAEVSPPFKLRWHSDLPGAIHAPATGAHGQLYVGAGHTLYALSPQDGSTRWTYTTQGNDAAPAISNPAAAISENKDLVQKVFLVDGAGHLHAINGQNGESFWTVENPSPGSFNSAPVSAAGQVFFMRGQGAGSRLLAFSTEGAEIWQQSPAGGAHTSTPLYGFGSLFYLGCANGPRPLTRRSDATGALAWEHEDPGNHPSPCFSNAVLDSDVELDQATKVYFGHRNNPPVVKAVRVSSGTPLWEQPLSAHGEVVGLALTQNRARNALIVAQRDRLYRLDRDSGEILWEHPFAANQSFNTSHKRRPQPIIWGDYVLHVTEGRRVLKALDLASGAEVWRFELDSSTDASPIAGGNTLYIGTESGRFYAFSPAD